MNVPEQLRDLATRIEASEAPLTYRPDMSLAEAMRRLSGFDEVKVSCTLTRGEQRYPKAGEATTIDFTIVADYKTWHGPNLATLVIQALADQASKCSTDASNEAAALAAVPVAEDF